MQVRAGSASGGADLTDMAASDDFVTELHVDCRLLAP